MNRKLASSMIVFLVLCLGLVAGFYAGKREGAKPGKVHKTHAATLRREEKELRRSLEKLELNNSALEKQLAGAQSDYAQCRERIDDFQRLQESENFVGPVFPEPAPVEVDDIPTKQRITELECEVAALKELVSRHHLASDSGAQRAPATGSGIVKAAELPATKEQCAAITKKGVRCSRVAKSNGKCWQHGG